MKIEKEWGSNEPVVLFPSWHFSHILVNKLFCFFPCFSLGHIECDHALPDFSPTLQFAVRSGAIHNRDFFYVSATMLRCILHGHSITFAGFWLRHFLASLHTKIKLHLTVCSLKVLICNFINLYACGCIAEGDILLDAFLVTSLSSLLR